MYSNDGGVIVNRSIVLKEPVVYVSMNHRWAQLLIVLRGFLGHQSFSLPFRCVRASSFISPKKLNALLAFGFLAS